MADSLQELLEVLDLEPIEVNIFRGKQSDTDRQRVFGGLVIAQALVAATRTVEKDRPPHSMHAYFLRPGDPKIPILYDVDRIRDGTSFTTRRVVAIQHGRAIFSTSVSFQVVETGVSHQMLKPPAPAPLSVPSERERLMKLKDKFPQEFGDWLEREWPIESREIDPWDHWTGEKKSPDQKIWMRTIRPLPDDPLIHAAVFAYASDMDLLGTGMRPHGLSWRNPRLQSASLDHAIWFHRPFRMDGWLLFDNVSPNAAGARSFNRGEVYTEEGLLVASVAQEGLVRLHPERKKT